ncbi:MAG: AAA family ATPase [Clostridia bacterium]|nr:AAA family ATPase [Clostridia bacterium]
MNNLVLIGLPGCGKTTLGRAAAKALGREFLDLDAAIEQEAGMTIPQLFEQFGEDDFRRRETAACRRAAAKTGAIVSCGGGVVTRPENMQAFAEDIVLFIDRPAENIVSGVDTAHRPLLKDGADRVYRLAAERDPLYRRYAHAVIRNDGTPAEAIAKLVRLAGRPLKLAVIGDPIDHSLSPQIHLPLLRRFHPQTTYEKIRVARGELAAFADYAREHLDGFNLTMPHKADILPYLDYIDPSAKAIGAVNTVTVKEGALSGYSTDGRFYDALQADGFDLAGKRIVLIGAGGAADTLAVAGAEVGIDRLTVVARRAEQREALLKKALARSPKLVTAACGFDRLSEAVAEADVLINATPLGMHGVDADWEDLSFLKALPSTALVCDLIYNPSPTRFLREAASRGHDTRDGSGMLIWQAIGADEHYLETPLNGLRCAQTILQQRKEL